MSRAELMVALDYPRWLSLARLIRRCVARIVDRKPICNGNRETLRNATTRDSIIVWHFRSFQRKRDRMRAWETDPDRPPVLRFASPRQLDAWVEALR